MDKESLARLILSPLFNKAGFYLLFCAFLITLFQSCELEPNPTGNKVDVQLLNYDGFQTREHGVYTSIGEYPLSVPDYNGVCRFRDVQIPYDLKLGTEWRIKPYIFKGLLNTNPVIIIPGEFYYSSHFHPLKFTVNFPPIEHEKLGIIKFISKDLVDIVEGWNISHRYVYTEYISSCYKEIRIPIGKTSISGKLIFLEGKGYWDWYTGELIFDSFDYYGSKDITIQYEMQNNFTFTPEEIGFDPAESSVEFSASYPVASNDRKVRLFLDFKDYCSNSKMLFAEINHPLGSNNIRVPLIPDLNFNINILSSYGSHPYGGPYFESACIEPGSQINIVHKKTEQLSPENGETGVTGNNYLTVKDDGEKGIYIFYIWSGGPSYERCRIVTDKNSIRLGDLNYAEFKFYPGTAYSWYVLKLSAFNSMDEFTSEPFSFNKNYHSISYCESLYFVSAP